MSLLELRERDLQPNCRVIALEGELDLSVADQLERALQQAKDFPVVLVDLRLCEFIDSTGIAALVHAHQERSADGFAIALTGPNSQVLRVLSVTGLTDNGLVFDTAEKALEQIAGRSPEGLLNAPDPIGDSGIT